MQTTGLLRSKEPESGAGADRICWTDSGSARWAAPGVGLKGARLAGSPVEPDPVRPSIEPDWFGLQRAGLLRSKEPGLGAGADRICWTGSGSVRWAAPEVGLKGAGLTGSPVEPDPVRPSIELDWFGLQRGIGHG
ncbi:hypothetical protein V6N12_005650 [Hibiscus sabdariffa]|uniref:Uncharacterized protein n=1 Tax=Hibiscus sabdariffa TaxID=183260 RepID=A0ABR2BAI8_9ROSI